MTAMVTAQHVSGNVAVTKNATKQWFVFDHDPNLTHSNLMKKN